MIKSTFLIWISLVSFVFAGQGMGPGPGVKAYTAGGGECDGYLACQNFEGTGYDNSETWTEDTTDGVVDEDYTTTVLRGSQSLQLTRTTAEGGNTYKSITPQSTVWVFLRMQTAAIGSDEYFLKVQDESGTVVGTFLIRTSGVLRFTHGAVNCTGTTVLSASTTYFIWLRYTAGTGADGVTTYYVGTSATRPGAAEASCSTGSGTASIGRVQLKAGFTTKIMDQILIKATEITDVPN